MPEESRPERNVDRERLQVGAAGDYRGLGEAVGGLLLAAFGAANLLSQQSPRLGVPSLYLTILLAAFVLPRLFQRFYYRRKFGYVRSISASPSWKVIWISTGAFALFIFLIFAVSDYMRFQFHLYTFELEPVSLFLGALFLLIAIPKIAIPSIWNTHQYEQYELLMVGLVLLGIAFLPVLHLQTKQQVSNGWLWVVFGTAAVISGLHAHRVLVRNLAPSVPPEHHA